MLHLLQTSNCQLVSHPLIPPVKGLSYWIQKSSSLEAHQAMLHFPAKIIKPYVCDSRVETLKTLPAIIVITRPYNCHYKRLYSITDDDIFLICCTLLYA